MAWLTKITADEQVDYRLRAQAGCSVLEASPADTVVLADVVDDAVDYRLRPEGDGALVWLGTGLQTVGLVSGQSLDEAGKKAAGS